jgi:predicted glycosyltransferase
MTAADLIITQAGHSTAMEILLQGSQRLLFRIEARLNRKIIPKG